MSNPTITTSSPATATTTRNWALTDPDDLRAAIAHYSPWWSIALLSFWLILTLTVVFWSLFPQYAWYNAVGKKVFVVGEKVCGWNWGETRDRRSDVGEVGSARVGREGIEMGVLGNRGVPGVVQSERGTRRKFGETGWRRLD